MDVDYTKKYFLMSFRFHKKKPEDFGLSQSHSHGNIFINTSDHSEWIQKELYDFGWGNEYGFVRLPELDFLELWNLLENSKLQENQYGAAYTLEKKYPDALLNHLLGLFSVPKLQITEALKETFKVLHLQNGRNRSDIIGKSSAEIDQDFENWKFVSKKVNEILK